MFYISFILFKLTDISILGDFMKNKKLEKQTITYGKKLKNARISLGLTQEQVAEILDLAPRYISDIERDKTRGSIDTFVKLCNIYKITPNDLLSEFINFDIPKTDPELIGFYNLKDESKEVIYTLIRYFNQQQNN